MISSVVEVGLLPLNRSVAENETFEICVELITGHLGCNVTVPLNVNILQNTTIGKDVAGLLHTTVHTAVTGGLHSTGCSWFNVLALSVSIQHAQAVPT